MSTALASVVTNTYTTGYSNSLKPSVDDKIGLFSPDDTPFMANMSKVWNKLQIKSLLNQKESQDSFFWFFFVNFINIYICFKNFIYFIKDFFIELFCTIFFI